MSLTMRQPRFGPYLALLLLLPAFLGSVYASDGQRVADAGIEVTWADSAPCHMEYVRAVGMACQLPNGLYQVVHDDGYTHTTHGPDLMHDGPGGDPFWHPHEDPADPEGPGTAGSQSGRHPYCASSWAQHVLYGYPANGQNRINQYIETIRTAIRSMNEILNEDALESGGVTADYRVLCHSDFQIRVDSFVVPSSSSDFSAIVSAARAAGFSRGDMDYTIFYDGTESGVCGVGHISYDERPGENNANNNGGDYGVTYRGCWTGRTPMHENGHNQGAVQRTAPDSDGAGHCLEGRDIMCYPTSSFLVLCPDRTHFDCDHDTYFDADPEPGEWLASNWNIGSRVNRFIEFDAEQNEFNAEPLASFQATVTDNTVDVDASDSSDLDGDPLTFSWSFGDGTNASGVTASHTYASPGAYDIVLWVSDGRGGFATATERITIAPDVPSGRETFAFQGIIECAFGASAVQSIDRCDSDASDDFTVPITPGMRSVQVLVVWDENEALGGAHFGADGMRYRFVGSIPIGEGAGGSPLSGTHDLDPNSDLFLHGGSLTVHVRQSQHVGLVLGQPYAVCLATLYGEASPEAMTCEA